jgi:bifunctional ADP-heptose synthase (sugar kinase/adenylyltransferase)
VDTRSKIVTLEEAIVQAFCGRPVMVVTGYFDVLLAAHVRELTSVRDRDPGAILLVVLTTPEQPVLEARARAEMVAALAMVDYVVSLDDAELESLYAAFPGERIVHLEAAHQQRMRELIQHVHRRQVQ